MSAPNNAAGAAEKAAITEAPDSTKNHRATTTEPSGRSTDTRRRRRIGSDRTNWVATILLILGTVVVFLPLYVTVSMSLKTTPQALDGNAFAIPDPFTLDAFKEAWNLVNIPRGFLVSTSITVFTVTGIVLLAAMASYAIVRNWDRLLFKIAFFGLLAAMFIPFPVVALPQIRLTGMVGLDNPAGVILLHIMFQMSFSVLLFTAAVRGIPHELEEAARLEGANTWQVFWRVVFPLMAPMAATVGIFAFLQSWNDFMMPSMIIANPEWQTIPVLQSIFQTQFSNNYNVAFASYLMAMAPAIIVYAFTQRFVMSGVTQGAVK